MSFASRHPPYPTLFPYTTLFRSNALQMLAAAVLCVLLIACVNAANLLLVRGTSRQTELSVRRSLGATRGRLLDRKSTRLNSSHSQISYAVFCLKKKNT